MSAHVAVLDQSGDIIAVNRPWRRFAEAEGGLSDYVGENYLHACESSGEPFALKVARGLRAILAGEQEEGVWEYPCHAPDERRWFLMRATRHAGSGPARVVVTHRDVTPTRSAQDEATLKSELLDEIDASVMVADLDMHVISWSRGAEQLYGWSEQEALGRRADELITGNDVRRSEAIVAELLALGRWEGEFLASRKDGSTFTGYFRNHVLLDEDGAPRAVVGLSVDISAIKEASRQAVLARNYLSAVTDSISEPMFTLDTQGLLQYLNPAAERALGWSTDELRGRSMHAATHSHRPDGSHFPVEECPIVRARTAGETVRVQDDLFIRRDDSHFPVEYTATPFATEDGLEGCVVVFADISERKAQEAQIAGDLEKLRWAREIQDALLQDRFVLYGQPILDLRSGQMTQQELLIRMRAADEDGVVAPGVFLPAAEELGLITEIDRWVIDRSADLAATGVAVELNVSARSISEPALIGHIERALHRSGAAAHLLVFEITETAVMSNMAAAETFATRLRKLGCRIALDDFGTGFGSFTYLKALEIDYLKIDIEFVRDLTSNPASRTVVEAVVSLAQGFGLRTIGEGVEDEQTEKMLRAMGVDYAQGYHIGRPAPLQSRVPAA
jgi:PAS domain S-box-containing protein